MKHLKLFQTEAEYTTYKNGSDYITPNVSYAVDSTKVFYNPRETKLVCTYNVTDTTNSTKLCNNVSDFTSMEVDSILLDNVITEYTFDTVGEHTVKFELADSVTYISGSVFYGCTKLTAVTIPDSVISIGTYAFGGCSSLTSITIPDSVTSIGGAFSGCTKLTSITIPNSVTSIGGGAFGSCWSLNEITCLATTAPSIKSGTLNGVKEGGVLKVPTGSDYSSWMSTDSGYLGYYNWTIEYI